MRKTAAFFVILAFAVNCNALSISLLSGGAGAVNASLGDIITVDLVADVDVTGITQIDFISSTATLSGGAWGSWADPGSANPGTIVGGDIISATGNAGVIGTVGTSLYSFSATITGFGTITPVMTVDDFLIDGTWFGVFDGTLITQNSLSVVPEPVTLVLLGIGCLGLRRKIA